MNHPVLRLIMRNFASDRAAQLVSYCDPRLFCASHEWRKNNIWALGGINNRARASVKRFTIQGSLAIDRGDSHRRFIELFGGGVEKRNENDEDKESSQPLSSVV
jgi:hypothetical protein